MAGRSACWPAAACRPAGARPGELVIRLDGRPLLGSPLDLQAIRRVEGFVEREAAGSPAGPGIPAIPAGDPVLTLRDGRGHRRRRSSRGELDPAPHGPFTQPRRFRLAPAALAGLRPPFAVLGADGREPARQPARSRRRRSAAPRRWRSAVALLFPARRACPAARRCCAEAAHAAGARPPCARAAPALPARQAPRAPPTSSIPVYRGLAATRACLDSVLRTVPAGTRVIVVDDASPEPALVAAAAAAGRSAAASACSGTRSNRGFPAAANEGMRAAGRRDVVLLNSDTLVPPGWLERLREAAYSAPDIGTVTPLSNDATILSYPGAGRRQPAAATGRHRTASPRSRPA